MELLDHQRLAVEPPDLGDLERGIDAGTIDLLVSEAELEERVEFYNDFFFHYDEAPLLVVNTSDIDLAGSSADADALVAVVRRHRKGIQHYNPTR